jgi:hypothetical protein
MTIETGGVSPPVFASKMQKGRHLVKVTALVKTLES